MKTCTACLLLCGLLLSGCASYEPSTGQKLRDLFWMDSAGRDIAGLTDSNAATRRFSVQRLVARGRTDMAPRIVLLLDERNEEDAAVRAAAASAMRAMKHAASAPELARHLDDPNPAVRHEIARSLGVIGSMGEAPALEQQLSSALEAPAIRAECAYALAEVGGKSAMPGLAAAMDVRDDRVRFAAHDALIGLAGTDAGPTRAAWERWLRNPQQSDAPTVPGTGQGVAAPAK
jgi:HEAT repeat protein